MFQWVLESGKNDQVASSHTFHSFMVGYTIKELSLLSVQRIFLGGS